MREKFQYFLKQMEENLTFFHPLVKKTRFYNFEETKIDFFVFFE